MNRYRVNAGFLIVGVVAALTASAGVATAAPPERETITFSDTFPDEELTEARGVDVTTSFDGRITLTTFAGGGVGPENLNSVHVNFVATAGTNRVVLNDVGIDMVRITPDGTAILMIVGQIPLEFSGVLMVDLATGEAILEPRHVVDTTRACRLLAR